MAQLGLKPYLNSSIPAKMRQIYTECYRVSSSLINLEIDQNLCLNKASHGLYPGMAEDSLKHAGDSFKNY
jgi:hypothetical protein